jgi:hypothetical protein
MTQILGISGRRQSGKTTSTNYIFGQYLCSLGIIKGAGFAINDNGELYISDWLGDKRFEGVLDITRDNPTMRGFLRTVNPFIKVYPLAEPLKKIAVELLGLKPEQVNGTDEQKNEITDCKVNGKRASGRQVMQWLGENLRKLYPDVYINYALKQIAAEQPILAIINDVRYPNEVDGILNAGGKVARLDRVLYPEDTHESETSLDKENYDWSKFTAILSNSTLSIAESNVELDKVLVEWGYLPKPTPTIV